MHSFFLQVDDVLRAHAQASRRAIDGQGLRQLLTVIGLFGLLYGAFMGTFGGAHSVQVLYSALKVPLLLIVTFCLSLPSFFVMNSLAGLRDDFGAALRALAASQASLAVILASLAPFTILWYASTTSYHGAILFNAAMFAVASVSAQRLLHDWYRPLIGRNQRHRWMLILWLALYGFTGIQMGWVLRPFIGDPGKAPTFFRADSWGNAYVVLFRMLSNTQK